MAAKDTNAIMRLVVCGRESDIRKPLFQCCGAATARKIEQGLFQMMMMQRQYDDGFLTVPFNVSHMRIAPEKS
jgi:hypothetical protein